MVISGAVFSIITAPIQQIIPFLYTCWTTWTPYGTICLAAYDHSRSYRWPVFSECAFLVWVAIIIQSVFSCTWLDSFLQGFPPVLVTSFSKQVRLTIRWAVHTTHKQDTCYFKPCFGVGTPSNGASIFLNTRVGLPWQCYTSGRPLITIRDVRSCSQHMNLLE